MVRATAAEIKKLSHGKWPAPATDSSVGDMCAGIDYKLDAYVKKHYSTSLSTTDTSVVHIANMMGRQEVLRGSWALGIFGTNVPEPELFTKDIIMLIEAAISDTSKDGASYIELQDDS